MTTPRLASLFSARRSMALALVLPLFPTSIVLGQGAGASVLRPALAWHEKTATGADLGLVRDAQAPQAAKEDRPGRVKPYFFGGGSTFKSELPSSVRGDTNVLQVVFSGVARPRPDDGMLLDLDGAILGFIAKRDEKTGRGTAQLAARDLDERGNLVWRALPVLFHLSPQQEAIIASPIFAVRLNHSDNSWSLYQKDLLIAEDLPLLTDSSVPAISIRPGRAGDSARLIDLQLSRDLPRRTGSLPTIDGRAGLKSQFEAGNPSVRAFLGDRELPRPVTTSIR